MTVRTFWPFFCKFAAPIDQKSSVALLGDTKMHGFFPQISGFKYFSQPAVAHLLIIQFLHRRLLFQIQTVTGSECPSVLPLLDHG